MSGSLFITIDITVREKDTIWAFSELTMPQTHPKENKLGATTEGANSAVGIKIAGINLEEEGRERLTGGNHEI